MKKPTLTFMYNRKKYKKSPWALTIVMMLLFSGLMAVQLVIPNKEKVLSYDMKIPEQAIRLRILAHSDDALDQQVKRAVRDEVSLYVSGFVEGIETVEQARDCVSAYVEAIGDRVNDLLEEKNYPHEATVIYGEDIYFPTKVYDTQVYPQGAYEAVLITIGEGKGENWWCVLFPALCYIDFNGEMTVMPEEQGEKTDNQEEKAPQIEETSHDEQPEIRFWFIEQITSLIHKFSG